MSKEITNEVLANELKNLTTAIGKLEVKFNQFTPNNVLELKFKEIDVKLLELKQMDKQLELKLDQLKSRSALQVWITGTLSAGMGVLLTYLISFYLSNR